MTIVLLIIFIFMFIPLILAEIARNKSLLTLDDFFIHNRHMPLLTAFFTVYATWVSTFALLGATTSFYDNGPLYMTCFAWNILFALLFLVVGRRIWFYGKTNGYMTSTDFFSDIYGNKLLSLTITIVSAVFTVPYLVVQLFGGAILIETISNGAIPWRIAGLLFTLVIMIYLWSGGLRAIGMTDVFYGILIFISMVVTGVVFMKGSGGAANIIEGISASDPDFFILGPSGSSNSWLMWLAMFIIVPLGALMGPAMWIRMYAVSNEKTFKIMPLLLSVATIMYIGPLIGGTATKYLYPGATFSDNMLVTIIINNVPIIFAAFLICGIASASLSTANSQIHALATVYTIDVHRRYVNRPINDRKLLNVGRRAILVASIIVYILMLFSPNGILTIGFVGLSGTTMLFVPTLGTLLWEKANAIASAVGVWAGILITFTGWLVFGMHILYAAMLALAVNGILFITLSLLLPADATSKNKILKYKFAFLKRRID